ncbi:MAG TPA: RDD family protein [Chloroflexota bacterium]|jgi:uncharacterized RDD family membrane protein YckC|nr:RDD family protein [Chloroflexota bacterium]
MAGAHGDDYRLVLPENVELVFQVAGVGSRTMAAIVDYVVLYGGVLAAVIGFSLNRAFLRGLIRSLPLPPWVTDFGEAGALAIVVLLVFFAWWGYFLLFEMLWNGQTPGKRVFHLRVVRRDGQPISPTASLVRNVVRAADMFFLLGLVVMIIDRQSRRLGDLAAGTLVIREPTGGGRALIEGVALPDNSLLAAKLAPLAARITMEHYALIREYFMRARLMSPTRARDLGASLAADIAMQLDTEPTDVGDPEIFLAAVAQAFEIRHRNYEVKSE